jgi:prepilin-type N-terminal cleavage/methylation domain-containing protein
MKCNFKKEKNNLKNKGFTLVELMVTVGIFALMTGLLLAKYGTFNQSIILTNLAYDIALTIRNAQSYGLNVKSATRSGYDFNYPFGVHFALGQNFTFFADSYSDNPNGPNYAFDSGLGKDILISATTIKGGSTITSICAGNDEADCDTNAGSITKLDIVFERPNPNAIIMTNVGFNKPYAKITLKASDGSTKKVVIRRTGQIAVE